uniref:Small monomeric GTPase n=1 Tax=Periophthalmus magnuspinnatus TaxID=409849 RepID=A0A3B3Z9N0_9GOBI
NAATRSSREICVDSGVGKTCLTYRFCAGKFPEKTEATIGVDFRERLVDIDGEKIKVRVCAGPRCRLIDVLIGYRMIGYVTT